MTVALLLGLVVLGLLWAVFRPKRSSAKSLAVAPPITANVSGEDRSRIQEYFASFTGIEARANAGDYEGAYRIAIASLAHLSVVARDLNCAFRSPPLQYVATIWSSRMIVRAWILFSIASPRLPS